MIHSNLLVLKAIEHEISLMNSQVTASLFTQIVQLGTNLQSFYTVLLIIRPRNLVNISNPMVNPAAKFNQPLYLDSLFCKQAARHFFSCSSCFEFVSQRSSRIGHTSINRNKESNQTTLELVMVICKNANTVN